MMLVRGSSNERIHAIPDCYSLVPKQQRLYSNLKPWSHNRRYPYCDDHDDIAVMQHDGALLYSTEMDDDGQ